MKAIQVTHLPSGKLQAKAEGVPAIRRSKETLETHNPARHIAIQLCNKYNWLEDGKFRLEEGCLPNGDAVFVFVKNPEFEFNPDIRRDFRKLLEKYNAQLVALNRDDHQPSRDVLLRIESNGKFPRDTFVEFDYSVVNINDYSLSEEEISADG